MLTVRCSQPIEYACGCRRARGAFGCGICVCGFYGRGEDDHGGRRYFGKTENHKPGNVFIEGRERNASHNNRWAGHALPHLTLVTQ
jgi:hypothetical protein